MRACSLYAHILEGFHHKWVLDIVKSFFAYIEMILFFFQLIHVVYHTD